MSINDTDKLLVNRSSSSFYVEQKNLMAKLQDTDLMLVNRSNASYKITGAELKESIVPPAAIITPAIIAPPDGAGVGGDVTYTPKTSEVTGLVTSTSPTYSSDITIITNANSPTLMFDGDRSTVFETNGVTSPGSSERRGWTWTIGAEVAALFNAAEKINYYQIDQNNNNTNGWSWRIVLNTSTVLALHSKGAQTNVPPFDLKENVPSHTWVASDVITVGCAESAGDSGSKSACYGISTVVGGVETFLIDDKVETALTFLNANTYNADTDADMGVPISETFTAGQTVTGVKAGSDTAAGTLLADASGNTMTVEPSSGTFVDGMEVINETTVTRTAPSADDLEFVGSTPSDDPTGSINTWGDATWEVSTDSAFTAPMVGTKIITPGSNQTLLPGERGAIVLGFDTDYWARLSYNATDPALPNVTSSAVHFKTAISTAGWFTAAAAEPKPWITVTYGTPSTGILAGQGIFVAVANTVDAAMYSTDGINWTITSVGSPDIYAVTYGTPSTGNLAGQGVFVAVAYNGTNRAFYSTDGINWTRATSAVNQEQWISVTYGNGKFVAVCRTGNGSKHSIYSTDAINWTYTDLPADGLWYSITYGTPSVGTLAGQGMFVAVAYQGTKRIAYSTDGSAWTLVSAPAANNWVSVTYGNGRFVAVSDNNTNQVMYSTSGYSWALQTPSVQANWKSVTYGDDKYVAVAYSGANQIMYCDDNTNWIPVEAPGAGNWRSVIYGGGKFVAVANNGTDRIMYSFTGKSASAGTYYDTATDQAVTGDTLVNRYGIDPTTDNLKRLGVAELTEQPTYAVAGYQAVEDKYQPIEDLTGEVEKLEERNQVLAQYVAKGLVADAQEAIAKWQAEDESTES